MVEFNSFLSFLDNRYRLIRVLRTLKVGLKKKKLFLLPLAQVRGYKREFVHYMTALIFSSILTAFNFGLNQATWTLVLYSTQSNKSNESGDAVTKLTLAWWACVKTTISVVKRLLCGEPASKLTWARQNPFLFSPSLAPLPIQTKQCFPESKMKTEKKLHKSVVRKKTRHIETAPVYLFLCHL